MNDKKKTIIVGVLGAVLLAVGAFQFMAPAPALVDEEPEPKAVASADSPAPAAPGEPAAEAKDPLREMLLNLAEGTATPRDPFIPSGELVAEFANPLTKNPSTPPPPVAAPSPARSESYRPRPERIEPLTPMQGSLRPYPSEGGVLAGPVGGGSVAASPQNYQDSGYKVKGVIVGTKRMVVLEDSSGSQKLVPEGSSVDGDTTVVGIEGDRVVLRQRGRKTAVKLQEDDR